MVCRGWVRFLFRNRDHQRSLFSSSKRPRITPTKLTSLPPDLVVDLDREGPGPKHSSYVWYKSSSSSGWIKGDSLKWDRVGGIVRGRFGRCEGFGEAGLWWWDGGCGWFVQEMRGYRWGYVLGETICIGGHRCHLCCQGTMTSRSTTSLD